MEILLKTFLPGGLFLATLIFGVLLSQLGKPYNGLLFNVHKLLALGAVIVTVVQFSRALKGTDTLTLLIVLLILAGISVVALFASGALMSRPQLEKRNYTILLTIHRIAPVAMFICMALAVCLLGTRL